MSYPSRLGATAVEILESIHQHRLLSTGQLHELHNPQATRRWIQLVAPISSGTVWSPLYAAPVV
jgi:hypothetical protein